MNQPPATPLQLKTSGIRPRVHQRFEILNASDMDKIHAATLRILKEVGVRFDSPEALSLLRKAGAEIEGSQVRLPARMVEQAIESAPAKVTLYARDPAKNMYLGEGSIHFTSGFGATWVRDSETGGMSNCNIK